MMHSIPFIRSVILTAAVTSFSLRIVSRAAYKTRPSRTLTLSSTTKSAPFVLNYERKLVAGTFVDRIDRFIALVRLDSSGEIVKSHCVNPGRMEAFVETGAQVWLQPIAEDNTKRKCPYTWELVQPTGVACVCCSNTQRPNAVIKGLLEQRRLGVYGLDTWREMASEVTIPAHDFQEETQTDVHDTPKNLPKTRCDFRLVDADGIVHWIEVKNSATVYSDGYGYFPDSVSVRASRHTEHLAERVAAGERASVLFTCREDVKHGVRPSDWHDPTFSQALRTAGGGEKSGRDGGVRMLAVRVRSERVKDSSGSLVWASVVHPECDVLRVDLEPYDLSIAAAGTLGAAASTGWTRSFGPGSPRRVANLPFSHNKKLQLELDRAAEAREVAPESG
jgi:sugar fermentation stimulation protein A